MAIILKKFTTGEEITCEVQAVPRLKEQVFCKFDKEPEACLHRVTEVIHNITRNSIITIVVSNPIVEDKYGYILC